MMELIEEHNSMVKKYSQLSPQRKAFIASHSSNLTYFEFKHLIIYCYLTEVLLGKDL